MQNPLIQLVYSLVQNSAKKIGGGSADKHRKIKLIALWRMEDKADTLPLLLSASTRGISALDRGRLRLVSGRNLPWRQKLEAASQAFLRLGGIRCAARQANPVGGTIFVNWLSTTPAFDTSIPAHTAPLSTL